MSIRIINPTVEANLSYFGPDVPDRSGEVRTMIMRIKGLRLAVALVALVLAVSPFPLFAQVTGATLSGTITDASGAVLPGVQVIITNLSTEVARKSLTQSDGFYSAPNLLPGSYEVTASASGFATVARKGIT